MSEWRLGDTNKSWSYILPMLGDNYKEFWEDKFPKSNLVNVFVGDDSIDLKDCILLLYKFSGKEEFINFENELIKHPEYTGSYEPDKSHTMYIFNVPSKYLSDYKKFLEGKYSEISENYKKHIFKFHESRYLEGVLYKKESAFKDLEKKLNMDPGTIPRTQEASSKPTREKEFFQEKYKKKDAIVPNLEFLNESTETKVDSSDEE